MRLRLLILGAAIMAVLTAQTHKSPAAEDSLQGLDQPYGASPYYMPTMSPPPPPRPAIYAPPPQPAYTAGAARPSAAQSLDMPYGPSPYYMPKLSTSSPSAEPLPARPAAPSSSYQAGAGKAYDMSILLNQRHPFETGYFPQPRTAPPPPAAAPSPPPQQIPLPKPTPATDDLEPLSDEELLTDEDLGIAATEGDNDPLEPMNRFFFGFNEYLQDFLLRPIATAYNWLPGGVRSSVGNFLGNINSPVVLANDLLQFEFSRAWDTTMRAAINTTAGVGGLFDVADYMDIPGHKEDFGQTLGVWGVDEMFYVVLPLFGPSSSRDAVGKMFVDNYFDPLGFWLDNTGKDELAWSRTGVSAVNEYAGVVKELDQIKSTSIDYYAAVRSMYRQKRESEIRNGDDAGLPAIPDLYEELDNMEAN